MHNLHGIPGIFGGIAGAVITALAQVDSYGYEGFVVSSLLQQILYTLPLRKPNLT